MNYEHKQAMPDQFIFVRLRRKGTTVIHCKVNRCGDQSKRGGDTLLKQQFGEHANIKWTAEDHADVEV